MGEVRGPFGPIATAVPGIRFCELLPKTALLADKLAVLRAVSSDDNAHSSSGYYMLTGVPHAPTSAENVKPGAPNDWPCLPAVLQHLRRGSYHRPAAIVLPERLANCGNIPWPGQDGGLLGRSADPWLIMCDPSSPDFQIPGLALPGEVSATRLRDRLSLLDQVNERLDAVDRSGAETDIMTKGRHDPCVGIRAVPVGEAMMACVLADHFLRHRGQVG